MVKGDHIVEQHQVEIPEAFRVLRVEAEARLRIFQIVIGKIAYQSAGEGGKPFDARTPPRGEDPAEGVLRPLRLRLPAVNPHHAVAAGDFHARIIAEESVASPVLLVLRTVQDEDMV